MIGLEKLNKDVAYFMDAFFKVAKDGFNFDLLNDFPIACCEFSSMLLARFLIEKQRYDATDLLIVMGQCKKDHLQLHLWLEFQGTICDITAGQFEDAPKNVIISNQSSWHSRFHIVEKTFPIISFDEYWGDFDEPVLEQDYQLIVSHIGRYSTIPILGDKNKKKNDFC